MKDIKIADRIIGESSPPFVIAEMSGNHNQSLDRALAIVEAAATTGVDALKLQTYTADTITIDKNDGEFFIDNPNSLWKGNTLYQLYQQAHTPWEWHEPIMSRCRELGLICFSSPFDFTAVDFLEALDTPAYKIASPELVDIPLIKKAAATGKPLIMSTGMATLEEIDDAVNAARSAGCQDLILLKCTSNYPADPKDSNLRAIPLLKEKFGVHAGLSDHTFGLGAAVAATALGATVIEKHLTLSREEGGVDAAFSLEPAEMKALVLEVKRAWQSLGRPEIGPTPLEKDSIPYRRSLYAVQDIREGEKLTPENVRSIRPGLGLAPKFYEEVLGLKAARNIDKGLPLSWELIER